MDDETLVEPVIEREQEKTLTQSQVNEIVKREKASVADRVRRELEAQMAQVQAGPGKDAPQVNSNEIEDKVFNRILEHAKKLEDEAERKSRDDYLSQQKARLEEEAGVYLSKVALGKDKISDFEEVMKDFEPSAFPQLALLAGRMDNTAEVMYELSKNPEKLARLDYLANKSEKLAMKELEKLSQSLVQNAEAMTNNVTTNAPLSRLKSSTAGVDSGKMGLKDFKNASWLKG
jgi:hypothetical protein